MVKKKLKKIDLLTGNDGRLELGELLIRLGQLDKASETVQELPSAKRALLAAKESQY